MVKDIVKIKGTDQFIHKQDLLELKKRHKAEIKKLKETNSKFISIIAHDLRAPFNTVMGLLSLLKSTLNAKNIEEAYEIMALATESASSAVDLVDSLSIWALSLNADCITPTPINLNELLIDEINAADTSASQKQVILRHNIQGELVAMADSHMVKTVVRNLINNAIKFTFPTGEVAVSARYANSSVEVSITDTGIGIPTNAQKYLFKKNGYYHTTRGTGDEKGTGLGLIICKDFVDLHGGNISVSSRPGKGSEFKFTLPQDTSST